MHSNFLQQELMWRWTDRIDPKFPKRLIAKIKSSGFAHPPNPGFLPDLPEASFYPPLAIKL
jgi:hypothetical protein